MTNETKLLGFTPAGPGAVEERWQHVEVEVMDWDRVDDRQALKTWLDSYAHGPATTLRNVTKEADPSNFIDFGPGFGGILLGYFPEPRTFGVTAGIRF